jgi:hypothetical protein
LTEAEKRRDEWSKRSSGPNNIGTITARKQVEEAKKELQAAMEASALDMLAKAALDPDALRGLTDLMKLHPGSFPAETAKGLENASPKAIGQQKAAKDLEEANRAWDEADKLQAAAEDKEIKKWQDDNDWDDEQAKDDEKRKKKDEEDAHKWVKENLGKWIVEPLKERKKGLEVEDDDKKRDIKGQQRVIHHKIEDLEEKNALAHKHKSQFMEIDQFFKSLQTSGMKSGEDKQLEELKKQQKTLERIADNTSKQIKATFS